MLQVLRSFAISLFPSFSLSTTQKQAGGRQRGQSSYPECEEGTDKALLPSYSLFPSIPTPLLLPSLYYLQTNWPVGQGGPAASLGVWGRRWWGPAAWWWRLSGVAARLPSPPHPLLETPDASAVHRGSHQPQPQSRPPGAHLASVGKKVMPRFLEDIHTMIFQSLGLIFETYLIRKIEGRSKHEPCYHNRCLSVTVLNIFNFLLV